MPRCPQVRSNFVGTEFTVFDHGLSPTDVPSGADAPLRCELAIVNYTSNILGSRGPRKMKVGQRDVMCDVMLCDVMRCDAMGLARPAQDEGGAA